MTIRTDELIRAYIGMRDQAAEVSEKTKAFKADIENKQQVIIDYLLRECKRTGQENFSTDYGTAFKNLAEFVNIEDKMAFIAFLLNGMLLAVFPNRYRDENGEWHENGEELLKRDRGTVIDSEMFDFINITPNKTNCIEYMKEHNGVLPRGLKYTSENTMQFRKPAKRKSS